MTETKPTMGVRAAAKALDCHENTIRNWIASGRLKAHMLPSGVQRPYAEDILALVERQLEGDVSELRQRMVEIAGNMEAEAVRLLDRARLIREMTEEAS